MSVYDYFGGGGRARESLDDAVRRLRGELASGELHVRPELAELLMRQAHFAAESTRIDDAVRLINESISIVSDLVRDGQYEYRASAVRCKMFKAVLIRIQKGMEASLAEFNEVIRYINDNIPDDDINGMNMLAITLMNKSDILNTLGANAAAAAAQEHAARIWERLVDLGSIEFRSPLITALLALGNTHVQMGDSNAGLADYQRGLSFIRDGIDGRLIDDETDYTGYLIQTLMNISRLVDRFGNTRDAISYADEAINTIVNIVTNGHPQIMPILTGLYQHRGMLLDKSGNHTAALDDFERARDIYLQSLRRGHLGSPADYVVRTGLANTLMCCANIYAHMKRFKEAAAAYEEAIRVYQQAAEFRPVDDNDETFLPYSIGIIQLNYANMLIEQGQLEFALSLQDQSIKVLQSRYSKGHFEVLPNLVSAYRRMADVQRMLSDFPAVFATLEKLIELLEGAIDNGNFEFRGELAIVFALRSVLRKDMSDFDAAIEDTVRAMRIFRTISDDEIDTPETPWSKMQWGESLAEITRLYLAKGELEDGFEFFRKQIDVPYSEDDLKNRLRLFDILFGYSQYVEFVAKFTKTEYEKKRTPAKKKLRNVIATAIDIASRGVELIQKTYPAISEITQKEVNDYIAEINQNKEQQNKNEQDKLDTENIETKQNENEQVENEQVKSEQVKSEQVKSEQVESEQVKSEQVANEQVESEQVENEQVKSEQVENEQVENEQVKNEQVKSEQVESEQGGGFIVGEVGDGVIINVGVGGVFNDPVVRLFFFMKYTFFHQLRSLLYQLLGDDNSAISDCERSFIGWTVLISDLDKLYLQRQYYVREMEAMRAMEAERQYDGNYFESVKSISEMERRVPPSDFFEERWRYYVSELRDTLQRWALLELSVHRVDRAGMVYGLDVNLARDMVRRNVIHSDRFLILSLLSYAKGMAVNGEYEKAFYSYTEVLDLILNRLATDSCFEDYEMFRHIIIALITFLTKSNLAQHVNEILELYVAALEEFKLPLPDVQKWKELCTLSELEINNEELKKRCEKLLEKHPEGKK
jgi:tetratricopeptide (TPR) repeat protein